MFIPKTGNEFTIRINEYFAQLINGTMPKIPTIKAEDKKNATVEKAENIITAPALLTGLILHLGFSSRQQFEQYERKGKFARLLRQARLRIEIEYEKRLTMPSPTGAIFALKTFGWNEKGTDAVMADMPKSIRIEVIHSGPVLAGTEKDVVL